MNLLNGKQVFYAIATNVALFALALKFVFRKVAPVQNEMRALALIAAAIAVWHLNALRHFECRSGAHSLCAVGLCIVSHVTFWWAFWTCGRGNLALAYSNEPPHCLLRRGPFRLVRHPFYISYLLTWFAAPVALWSAPLALSAGVMGFFYFIAAKREEQTFAQTALGAEYALYRQSVGMFLPTQYVLQRRQRISK
jgi:protein-S-isoprenylcysteine O-methyltransferase Ste14